jgi:hypothetical protein
VLLAYYDLIRLTLQFKDAGVIEMEASIKACRILVEHQVCQLSRDDFIFIVGAVILRFPYRYLSGLKSR